MRNLPTIMLSKMGSAVSICCFYPRLNLYGETVGKLDTDEHMFIDASKLEQLSRDIFTQIEIHALSGKEVLRISTLRIEECDGIILYMNGKNKISAEFVKRGKSYDREWLMCLFPYLGVQQRIGYLLSFMPLMQNAVAAKTSTSEHAGAAAQPFISEYTDDAV